MGFASLYPSYEMGPGPARRFAALVRDTRVLCLVDRWLPKICGKFSLTSRVPPQLLRARFETGRRCSGMRHQGRTEGEQDLAKVNRGFQKVLVAQA